MAWNLHAVEQMRLRGCPKFGFHTGPWTGKCIGKRTLFAFHLFLITLSVHILFVVVGAIVVFAVK